MELYVRLMKFIKVREYKILTFFILDVDKAFIREKEEGNRKIRSLRVRHSEG